MEFHADLVAVSLTGSDALIHALYKLQVADEAYANTLEAVNLGLVDKKAVFDLYSLQSNYINKIKWVLNDNAYGESPKLNTLNPKEHRIFTSRSYNPPQMWSTHPADKDREENAKRVYIEAEIDTRSSWELLSNPEKYRTEMTAKLVSTAKVETEQLTDIESIAIQDNEFFNWSYLNPKYHSAYLNRFSFINVEMDIEVIYYCFYLVLLCYV